MSVAKKINEKRAKMAVAKSGKDLAEEDKKETALARANKLKNTGPMDLAHNFAELKLTFARAIDDLGGQYTHWLEALRDVQSSVETERAKLLAIHELQDGADVLQALIQVRQEEDEAFEQSLQKKREEWAKEVIAHQNFILERDQQLHVQRQREEAEFQYQRNVKRRAEAQEFEQGLKAREELIAKRERIMVEPEEEVQKLRAQYVAAQELAGKEQEAAVARATNALKKSLEHQHQLTVLELKAQLDLMTAKAEKAGFDFIDKIAENNSLKEQNRLLMDKVQAIAERAIDGASKQAINVQVPVDTTQQRK